MTKKIRGNAVNVDRDKFDFYPTDARWTQVLLDCVDLGENVWECAAGEGHITDVLEAAGIKVMSTDIQGYKGSDPVDFLEVANLTDVSIVTNPPYSLLDDFIEHALDVTDGTVALLANLQAMGGSKRTERIWTKTPPSLVIVIPERMVVNGKASQFCHAWYVWKKSRSTDTRIVWRHIEGK